MREHYGTICYYLKKPFALLRSLIGEGFFIENTRKSVSVSSSNDVTARGLPITSKLTIPELVNVARQKRELDLGQKSVFISKQIKDI